MRSLLDSLLAAVDKEATSVELKTGRGGVARDKIDEHIGISKGLRKAIEIIKNTAKAGNLEDD